MDVYGSGGDVINVFVNGGHAKVKACLSSQRYSMVGSRTQTERTQEREGRIYDYYRACVIMGAHLRRQCTDHFYSRRESLKFDIRDGTDVHAVNHGLRFHGVKTVLH